jgi:hypothetical protein
MDIILPKGKTRRIQCMCGRYVQKASYPSHILSMMHRERMREKNIVKVDLGVFRLDEV